MKALAQAGLLRSAVVDHYRHQAARGRALERVQAEGEPSVSDEELHEAVCRCVSGLLPTLNPGYRELLKRVEIDEQPLADVARELGITANNAGVRLHRARKALRARLERSCGSCATHGCLDCTCARATPRPPAQQA